MKKVKTNIIDVIQEMEMSKRPVGPDDWRFMITNVSNPVYFGLGWHGRVGDYWIYSVWSAA